MNVFQTLVGDHRPDILDCLNNLSSDEVFTPPSVAEQVLDLLPPALWSDPALRILDPACKSGVFLREAAKRLMAGLAEVLPDEAARRRHIFENMLYGLPITELTGLISRRSLYYSKDAASAHSVVCFSDPQGNVRYHRGTHVYKNRKCKFCGAPAGDLDRGEHLENYAYSFIHTPLKDIFDMKFDVIIGNPPYQLQDAGESTGASPIYQLFIEQAKKLEPRYISMIIPARWYAGGKGLDGFRDTMLKDRRISHLVDFHDASDIFPGVEIKGGVCYFLWDAKYSGDCEITSVVGGLRLESMPRNLSEHDVLVRFNQAVSILQKVKESGEGKFSERISRQKPFGFRTNFTDYCSEPFEGAIPIYANKDVGWIDRSAVTVGTEMVDQYKVLLSAAYNGGDNYPHQIINRPILAPKESCCTETYIICGSSPLLEEAQNIEAYIKTRFFRFMVSLRKISQHNPRDRFDFVPNLDMTQTWTDATLYERYGLTADEIGFVESMIKEMG
jgi:site-specific DNA-methyltransferase (adenine-specific)